MNEKIIAIAGIVFALIFIVLLAVMMSTVTEKTNTANAQMVDTLAMTEGTDVSQLDGEDVKGNYVISTINNGKTSSGEKMAYLVKTRASDDYVYYGYGSDSGNNVDITDESAAETGISQVGMGNEYKSYNITDSSSPDYVNETDVFILNVLKNNNDVVVGVAFTQNGAN